MNTSDSESAAIDLLDTFNGNKTNNSFFFPQSYSTRNPEYANHIRKEHLNYPQENVQYFHAKPYQNSKEIEQYTQRHSVLSNITNVYQFKEKLIPKRRIEETINYDCESDSDEESSKTPSKKCKLNQLVRKTVPDTHSFIVKGKEMKAYFSLLDDPLVDKFLNADSCHLISDKYLLAMVFAYFKRALFSIKEFNRKNFFLALYLANDMEEDEEEYKFEIFPWALGNSWKKTYMSFLYRRDQLWARMDYRAVVSRRCCDEIMAIEKDHWVWKRTRPEYHSGAIRSYLKYEDEDDNYPRGPNAPARYCEECAANEQYDSASPDSTSWYLSSEEESACKFSVKDLVNHSSSTTKIPFIYNMQGLRQTLQEDSIWAHKEE